MSWRSEITLKQTVTPANPPIFPLLLLKSLPSYPLTAAIRSPLSECLSPTAAFTGIIGVNQLSESHKLGKPTDVGRAGERSVQGCSTAGSPFAGSLQGSGFAAGQAGSWEQLPKGNHNPCSEER